MSWIEEVKEFIEQLNLRVTKSQYDGAFFESTAERLIELYGHVPAASRRDIKRAIIQLIQAINGSYWTYKSYLLDTNYLLKQVLEREIGKKFNKPDIQKRELIKDIRSDIQK